MMELNAQVIEILLQQILPEIKETNKRLDIVNSRLATLNGAVLENVKDIAENKIAIDKIQTWRIECAGIFSKLKTMLSEREKRDIERRQVQTRDADAIKANAKDTLAKVWDISYKVAGLVALVGMLAKLAGLW